MPKKVYPQGTNEQKSKAIFAHKLLQKLNIRLYYTYAHRDKEIAMRDASSFATLEDYKRYKARREEVWDSAQALIQALASRNDAERDGARDGLAQALRQEHPSLRQAALRVLRDSCREIRDLPADLRSEGSQKLIQVIADFDEPMPFI